MLVDNFACGSSDAMNDNLKNPMENSVLTDITYNDDPEGLSMDVDGQYQSCLGFKMIGPCGCGHCGSVTSSDPLEKCADSNLIRNSNNIEQLFCDYVSEATVEHTATEKGSPGSNWSVGANSEFVTHLSLGNELLITGNCSKGYSCESPETELMTNWALTDSDRDGVQERDIDKREPEQDLVSTEAEVQGNWHTEVSSSNYEINSVGRSSIEDEQGKTFVIPVIKVPTLTVTRVHLLNPKSLAKTAALRPSSNHQNIVPITESNHKSVVQKQVEPIYKPRSVTDPGQTSELGFANREQMKNKTACFREHRRTKQLNDAFLALGKAAGICRN